MMSVQTSHHDITVPNSPTTGDSSSMVTGRTHAKETIDSLISNSVAQNVLSTSNTTIIINDGTKTVLPQLSQERLATTLNNKMEYLSVTGRCLDRRFTRGFYKTEMGNLKRLVLTGNKLQEDSRGARLLLSSVPASVECLNLSWNGLGEEAADVLGRRILHLKDLKSIGLAGNPLGLKGLQNLIDLGNLHHVEELDLRQCHLGVAGAKLLGKIISENEDSRVQRVVLDMKLLAAFSKTVTKQGGISLKVQVDTKDECVFLELERQSKYL